MKRVNYTKKSKGKKIISKSNVCTISNERQQVKTYMDNSNGIRNPSSNSYNKVIFRFIFLRMHESFYYMWYKLILFIYIAFDQFLLS